MKNLPLFVLLSRLALENSAKPIGKSSLLRKTENLLKARSDILGRFHKKRQTNHRKLGHDMDLREFRFDFEKQSVLLQLIRFQPRKNWQIQSFRFI